MYAEEAIGLNFGIASGRRGLAWFKMFCTSKMVINARIFSFGSIVKEHLSGLYAVVLIEAHERARG